MDRKIRAGLIDANFVIALLNRKDALHDSCKDTIRRVLCSQFITTWAVITESMYFAGAEIGVSAQQELCNLIKDGTYEVAPTPDIVLIRRYLTEYADMPLDFADATLAAHAMQSGIRHIYTHDEHFRAVRVPIDSDRVLDVIA